MNDSIKKILDKQCDMIGVKDVDYTADRWYSKYSWTKEQQDEFRDWLTDVLYTDKNIRKEVMFNPFKNKKRCKACADMWVFQYGWSVKE